MAKLPKKIDQEIKPLDLRQFVSSAAQKPASASAMPSESGQHRQV